MTPYLFGVSIQFIAVLPCTGFYPNIQYFLSSVDSLDRLFMHGLKLIFFNTKSMQAALEGQQK